MPPPREVLFEERFGAPPQPLPASSFGTTPAVERFRSLANITGPAAGDVQAFARQIHGPGLQARANLVGPGAPALSILQSRGAFPRELFGRPSTPPSAQLVQTAVQEFMGSPQIQQFTRVDPSVRAVSGESLGRAVQEFFAGLPSEEFRLSGEERIERVLQRKLTGEERNLIAEFRAGPRTHNAESAIRDVLIGDERIAERLRGGPIEFFRALWGDPVPGFETFLERKVIGPAAKFLTQPLAPETDIPILRTLREFTTPLDILSLLIPPLAGVPVGAALRVTAKALPFGATRAGRLVGGVAAGLVEPIVRQRPLPGVLGRIPASQFAAPVAAEAAVFAGAGTGEELIGGLPGQLAGGIATALTIGGGPAVVRRAITEIPRISRIPAAIGEAQQEAAFRSVLRGQQGFFAGIPLDDAAQTALDAVLRLARRDEVLRQTGAIEPMKTAARGTQLQQRANAVIEAFQRGLNEDETTKFVDHAMNIGGRGAMTRGAISDPGLPDSFRKDLLRVVQTAERNKDLRGYESIRLTTIINDLFGAKRVISEPEIEFLRGAFGDEFAEMVARRAADDALFQKFRARPQTGGATVSPAAMQDATQRGRLHISTPDEASEAMLRISELEAREPVQGAMLGRRFIEEPGPARDLPSAARAERESIERELDRFVREDLPPAAKATDPRQLAVREAQERGAREVTRETYEAAVLRLRELTELEARRIGSVGGVVESTSIERIALEGSIARYLSQPTGRIDVEITRLREAVGPADATNVIRKMERGPIGVGGPAAVSPAAVRQAGAVSAITNPEQAALALVRIKGLRAAEAGQKQAGFTFATGGEVERGLSATDIPSVARAEREALEEELRRFRREASQAGGAPAVSLTAAREAAEEGALRVTSFEQASQMLARIDDLRALEPQQLRLPGVDDIPASVDIPSVVRAEREALEASVARYARAQGGQVTGESPRTTALRIARDRGGVPITQANIDAQGRRANELRELDARGFESVNGIEGTTREELHALEQAFITWRQRPTTGGDILRGLLDITGLPQAIKSSWDISYPFRQAFPAVSRKEFYTSQKPMIQALASESEAVRIQARTREIPQDLSQVAQNARSGLAFTELPGTSVRLGQQEESFQIGATSFTRTFLKHFPGLAPSGRAFTVYGNVLRHAIYDNTARVFDRLGASPESYAQLARWVNNITGRANLSPGSREAMVVVNRILWSPQLLLAHGQLALAVVNPRQTAIIRKQMARDLVGSAMFGTGLLTLANVAGVSPIILDPRSSDFGKIKIGNTRIDPWGGFAQIARFIAMLASGQMTTVDGVTVDSGQIDTFIRFGRSKLDPAAALVVDIGTGETYLGDKFEAADVGTFKGFRERFFPLGLDDIWDAINEYGPLGIFVAPFALTGFGASTFSTNLDRTAALLEPAFESLTPEERGPFQDTKDFIHGEGANEQLLLERSTQEARDEIQRLDDEQRANRGDTIGDMTHDAIIRLAETSNDAVQFRRDTAAQTRASAIALQREGHTRVPRSASEADEFAWSDLFSEAEQIVSETGQSFSDVFDDLEATLVADWTEIRVSRLWDNIYAVTDSSLPPIWRELQATKRDLASTGFWDIRPDAWEIVREAVGLTGTYDEWRGIAVSNILEAMGFDRDQSLLTLGGGVLDTISEALSRNRIQQAFERDTDKGRIAYVIREGHTGAQIMRQARKFGYVSQLSQALENTLEAMIGKPNG